MENISTSERLQHLYWRAGFGATPEQLLKELRPVKAVVKGSREQAVFARLVVVDVDQFEKNKTLKKLAANGKPDRDAIKMRIKENAGLIRDLNVLWIEQMASGKDVLREKWHCSGMGISLAGCSIRRPSSVI